MTNKNEKTKKANAFTDKQAAILSSAELKQTKYKAVYWFLFAVMVAASLITVVPLIWSVLMGFKESSEIYAIPTHFFPKKINFAVIPQAWKEMQLGRSMLNTIVLSAGQIIASIVIAGLGGYVLSRVKPAGAAFVFTLMSITMMMPSEVRVIPTYMEFINLPLVGGSLKDTYFPMWILAAANVINVLLFKNYFDSISISMVEAARIDGCTDLGIFFKIILPLSVPIIMYIAITANNGAWNGFFWPMLMLDDTKKWVLPLSLYKRSADTQLNIYFMGLTFGMIPTFLIFLVFQRYIIGGINIGGVKG